MDIRYIPKEEFILLYVSWLFTATIVIVVGHYLLSLYESVANWVRERRR